MAEEHRIASNSRHCKAKHKKILKDNRLQAKIEQSKAWRSQAKPSTRSSYLLAWSPNSPDLTPPDSDFFVWGFVKDIIYSQKPRTIDDLRFKVCHGSLYAVMWLADEPREFNLPTLPQRRITYVPEKLPGKYGVHSEEHLPICTVTPVVAGIHERECAGSNESLTVKSVEVPATYPVRLLARSRANFARRLKQQITSNARRGKPRMQDTIGITIDSGDTATITPALMKQGKVSCKKIYTSFFTQERIEHCYLVSCPKTGEWRKLHNAELHALYSSPDITRNIKSRRLRWAGHVARMGESRNAYRVLVGRPEGKRPLGRPRRRREDNIKMDLREMGYEDRDWINLAEDRDRWRAYVGRQ
ncbi:hypothetical protein ANN_13612 [Periplaneta americana]|uniref:Uncharacterized protein n=1 Tax=Periplaneta americana TaxID=6978 RepID=A0ABQ8TLW5_PERAM|nr:hypothetical protein ANN_13612 [Periplaneta americana]